MIKKIIVEQTLSRKHKKNYVKVIQQTALMQQRITGHGLHVGRCAEASVTSCKVNNFGKSMVVVHLDMM